MMLCYSCMKPIESGTVCQHCGFRNNSKNPPLTLPMGTVLKGTYLIGRVTDSGYGFNEYIGFDFLKQEPVAIREYLGNGDPKFDFAAYRDWIFQRVQHLNQLQPLPSIITPDDWLEENNRVYLIEQHPEGENLRDLMRKRGGKLDAPQLLSCLQPVMENLERIHRENLFHMNINPGKIVMDAQGNAVLTGFAWTFHNPYEFGTVCGDIPVMTAEFCPLELLTSKGKVGPWSDVYALCCTIYFCLTGQRPVDSPERLFEGWEPDWYSVPGLQPQQRRVLQQGMAVRSENRIQTIRQLMDDLFGDPFVEADHFRGNIPEVPAGVPARPLMGAMTFDPGKGSGHTPEEPPRNWWKKLLHK